jgi:hypothetical protein
VCPGLKRGSAYLPASSQPARHPPGAFLAGLFAQQPSTPGAIFSAVSALGATLVSWPWSSWSFHIGIPILPGRDIGYILGIASCVGHPRQLQAPTLRNQGLASTRKRH